LVVREKKHSREEMYRGRGVTYHFKTVPADRTLVRARAEPVRNAIVAKRVPTPIDSVRVHEDVGANHASQVVFEPLRQASSYRGGLVCKNEVPTFQTLKQHVSEREADAPW
jgi:hypothetical protein